MEIPKNMLLRLGVWALSYSSHVEITDYANLDTLRTRDDPVFWNLIEQFLGLSAHEPTPGWLLREVGDTQITEPKNHNRCKPREPQLASLFLTQIYTFVQGNQLAS